MRVEGGRTRTTAGGSGNSSTLSFTSGSKTKVLTGKGVLEKARREAREMSLFSVRKTILATPTHKLNNKATQVRNAPQGLLDEHKKPTTPSYLNHIPKPPMIFAPRKSSVASTSKAPTTTGTTDTERERRLKAFTTPSSSATKRDNTGTPVSSSSSTCRPQNTSTFCAQGDRSTFASSDRETSFPSAAYKAPRLKARSSPGPPENGKVAVDPLMRAKRRKVA